jgi:hypothetical protein
VLFDEIRGTRAGDESEVAMLMKGSRTQQVQLE